MINRHYFYISSVHHIDGAVDYVDGIVTVKSWFKNPLLVWQAIRERANNEAGCSTVDHKIKIEAMNRV